MAAPPPLPSPSSSDGRAGRWLALLAGLAATIAAVVGVTQLWPEDDSSAALTTAAPDLTVQTTVPGATGEPSDQPIPPLPTTPVPGPTAHLFTTGVPEAIAQLAAAAGQPTQVLELAIYDEYAFLAYRDPAEPANIDRRMWRGGTVDDAEPNTGDDRFDAETEPALFALAELDLTRLPALLADAVTRYDIPVEVSHVIIDRFLPFDDRVLIRVYATPTDGRSGGGYVSYDTAGTFVKVCC